MKPKFDIDHILDFENRNFKAPELAKTILVNHLEKDLLISALNRVHSISPTNIFG